jgi:DNA-binding transcriptional ArsR family regulator
VLEQQVTEKDADISELVERSHAVAKVLNLLSNQKRLLILCALEADRECPVNALADSVELSQSALSQHLAKLRKEGLVKRRRDGQTLYYSLGDRQLERLLFALKDIYCP